MLFLKYVLIVSVSYLVGTVNPSYLIAKAKGFDIRQWGSGNAGASNAMLTMGKKIGAFSMAFDILKATAVVLAARFWFGRLALAPELAGLFCVLGHIFPALMHFKGGKGLASFGGMILALDWRVFLLMLAGEVVVVFLTNFICFAPITAAVAFPVIWGIRSGHWQAGAVFIPLAMAMVYRHRENLKRIRQGKELRFSYLWNKEAEVEKVTDGKSLAEMRADLDEAITREREKNADSGAEEIIAPDALDILDALNALDVPDEIEAEGKNGNGFSETGVRDESLPENPKAAR